MKYAKYISDTQIDDRIPRSAVYQGRTYTGDLTEVPGLLESLGFCPMLIPIPPDNEAAGTGKHWEARYSMDGRFIRLTWTPVADPPPPPRTFSKFKLKLAIAAAGFLPQFEQLLAGVEVAPGYSGADAFADAVTLDEDHPGFAAAVSTAKTSLGLSDEQVEAILAASVAGG